MNLLTLFTDPAQRRSRFIQTLIELLNTRRGALAVAAAVGGDAPGVLGAARSLFATLRHALRRCGQLRGGCGDLADLQLLRLDFAESAAGMLVEAAYRVAQLRGFVIDTKHARAQLHHGNVECGADCRQFVATHHRHLQAEVAIAQGFGEQGDAAGTATDRGLQADEQIQRRE
ncbi:hypothetical protein PS681_04228 [Pseudomonas fluorescens]|nr:hypothetical protein PS681_04228 [Pseudomonas fluorescens]